MVRQKAISARIDEGLLERIEIHFFGVDYPYKRNRNAFLNRAVDNILLIDNWRTWLLSVRNTPMSKAKKAKIILESNRTPAVLREILLELT